MRLSDYPIIPPIVGYGDIVPNTYCGRTLSITTGIVVRDFHTFNCPSFFSLNLNDDLNADHIVSTT